MFRQGDILLVRIEKLPEGLKKLKHRVLAEGEATGHKHEIAEDTALLYEDEKGAEMFVEAMKESLLVHAEHKQITLPPGTYAVIRQREYIYKSDTNVLGWHYVAD